MSGPTGTPQTYGSLDKIEQALIAGAGVFTREDVEFLMECIADRESDLDDAYNRLERNCEDQEVR